MQVESYHISTQVLVYRLSYRIVFQLRCDIYVWCVSLGLVIFVITVEVRSVEWTPSHTFSSCTCLLHDAQLCVLVYT